MCQNKLGSLGRSVLPGFWEIFDLKGIQNITLIWQTLPQKKDIFCDANYLCEKVNQTDSPFKNIRNQDTQHKKTRHNISGWKDIGFVRMVLDGTVQYYDDSDCNKNRDLDFLQAAPKSTGRYLVHPSLCSDIGA